MSSLDILGISEEEEKIYRILLVSGQLSAGEIQFALNMSLMSVEEILAKLIEKKLIREVPGIDARYACLLPVGPLKDELIAAASEVKALSDDLQQTSENVLAGLEGKLNQGVQTFEATLQSKGEELDQEVTTLSSETESKQQQNKTTIEESVSQLNEKQNEINARMELRSLSSVSQNAKASGEFIDGQITSVTESIEATKGREDQIKQDTLTLLPEMDDTKIDNTTTEIVGKLESYKSFHDMSVNELQQGIEEKVNEFQSGIQAAHGQLSSLKDAAANELASASDKLSDAANSTKNAMQTSLNQIKSDMDTTASNQKQSVTGEKQKVDEDFANLDSQVGSARNTISEANTSFGETYNQEISNLNTSIQEVINNVDLAAANQASELSNKMKETLQSGTNQLQEMVSKIIEDLNNSFASKVQEVSDQLATSRNTEKQKLEDKLTSIGSKLKDDAKTATDQKQGELNQLISSLSEQQNQTKQSIQNQLDMIIQSIDQYLGTIQAKITENENSLNQQIDAQQSEISSLKQSQQNSINENFGSVLESISADLNQKISDLKSVTQSTTSSSLESYTESHNEILTTLRTNVDELKAELVNAYTTLNQKLTEVVDGMYNTYAGFIDESGSQFISTGNRLKTNNDELKTDLDTIYQDAKRDIEEQFNGFATTIRETTGSLSDNVLNQVKELITKSSIFAQSSFDSMKQLVQSGTAGQISAVKETFSEYNSKYATTSSQVGDKATSLASVLDGIYQVQQDTKTIEISTTHIVGTDAILEQMKHIISRVKSKATILVPNIDMIDEESILSLPRTAQINIISYIDESTDKPWIDKMHGATANVTLRSIQRAAVGALPDFLGCEREGEEIMLAINDEKSKTYLGITSLAEDFVKILGNIVIADYARGKSKQIAK